MASGILAALVCTGAALAPTRPDMCPALLLAAWVTFGIWPIAPPRWPAMTTWCDGAARNGLSNELERFAKRIDRIHGIGVTVRTGRAQWSRGKRERESAGAFGE